jgi:hypothetical protein
MVGEKSHTTEHEIPLGDCPTICETDIDKAFLSGKSPFTSEGVNPPTILTLRGAASL